MQKSTDTKIARYIFDGWDHPVLSKKYMGDPGYWETEIRHEKDCPEIFRWISGMYFPAKPEETAETEFEGFEGRVLEVHFYKDHISPEDIEKFFDEYKIRVHRTSPFLIDDENTYNITWKEAEDFMNFADNAVKELKKKYPDSNANNTDNSDDKNDH